MLDLPPEVLDLLQPCPLTGCWFYDGRWDSDNGYGKKRWEGRIWVLHRLVWTMLKGPICPTFLLDHTCRQRACCNIEHLEPVTTAVNTHRGSAVLFR